MTFRPSFLALCIATSALTLTGCASLTGHRLPPTEQARISPHLLAPPPQLPAIPRNPDGTANGAQLLAGGSALYDVAGAIRDQLVALIDAVNAREDPQTNSTLPH